MTRFLGVTLAALLIAAPAHAKKPKKGKKAKEQVEEVADEVPVARPGAPATPDETVALPCGYEPGGSHRYRLVKRSERRAPGTEPTVQGSESTVELVVVSHEGSRTLLDVNYGDHEMLSPPAEPVARELLERLAEVTSGVSVRIEVDHEASTQRVVDLDALMTVYADLAEEVKAGLTQQDPPVPDDVLAWVDEALSNRDLAEQSIVGDLQPLFGFTCGEVPVGDVRYQTALPNPLGRSELPAVGTITGEVTEHTVEFGVHERLDPVKVMEILGPLMQQMGVELPEGSAVDDMQLEMGTDLEVVVDRATGWPTRWSSTRQGTVLGGGRVDTVVVTRLEPEPAPGSAEASDSGE